MRPSFQTVGFFIGTGQKFFAAELKLFLLVAQPARFFEVLVFYGSGFALLNVGQLVFQVSQLFRGVHPLDAHARACFVYEVYGFVGQLAIHYVAGREVGCGHESLVGDGDSVIRLVEIAQTFEYLYGVRYRGLVHADGLEAAFQSGVFF